MNFEDSLKIVLGLLEDCGIDYMITGSFASNVHGVPRTTYDADVVIKTNLFSIMQFIKLLGTEFYVSKEAAKEAVANYRIFNIIHYETGLKVDLIICKQRSFSQEEFNRRQKVIFLGKPFWFTSAEDTILSKLEWSKEGESERQFKDAVNVAKIQQEKLDYSYLKKWAKELKVSELLERLFKIMNRMNTIS